MNRDGPQDIAGNTEQQCNANKQDNQYVYWSFTWNNYHKEMIEIIFNVLKSECDWYIIQEEEGEEKNTPHLQGTLKLKKRKRLSELRRIYDKISWRATMKIACMAAYCSRKEKRTGRIWTLNFDIVDEIVSDFKPYGWQLEVIEILEKKPHDRIINWFWEPRGGVGKSEFAIWLFNNMNALLCMGKTSDIFHIMSKEKSRRGIFIFDITKEKMEHFQYTTIELIKNGYIISGKYDSSIVTFPRPHIIVFANTEPDRSKLTSHERWNIVKIKIDSPLSVERTHNSTSDERSVSHLELLQ